MHLSRATMDDALAVLEWRNDPVSCAMSHSGAVAVDDHMAWFRRAIADPSRIFMIGTDGERRVGMVRFDRMSEGWLVSINVAPAERRKGVGTAMLNAAIRSTPGPLLAEIKPDNAASLALFAKCGFVKSGERYVLGGQ